MKPLIIIWTFYLCLQLPSMGIAKQTTLTNNDGKSISVILISKTHSDVLVKMENGVELDGEEGEVEFYPSAFQCASCARQIRTNRDNFVMPCCGIYLVCHLCHVGSGNYCMPCRKWVKCVRIRNQFFQSTEEAVL